MPAGAYTRTCTVPVRAPLVAVMFAVPAATPVTSPWPSTVATAGFDVLHATVPPATPPVTVRTVPVTRCVSPTATAPAMGAMPIHPSSARTGACTYTLKPKLVTVLGSVNSHSLGPVVSPVARMPSYWKYFCPGPVKMSSPSALATATGPLPPVAVGPSKKKMRTPSGEGVTPSAVPSAWPVRFSSVTSMRNVLVPS